MSTKNISIKLKLVLLFVLGGKKSGSPKQESVGALGGLSLRRTVDAGEKELRGAGRESPTEPAPTGPSSLDGAYATLFISGLFPR